MGKHITAVPPSAAASIPAARPVRKARRDRTIKKLDPDMLAGADMNEALSTAMTTSRLGGRDRDAAPRAVLDDAAGAASKPGKEKLCPHLSQEELGRIGGMCAGRIGENKFCAGVVKDTRSRCQYRHCRCRPLTPGMPRIGKKPPSLRYGTSLKTTWYHLECAFKAFRSCARKSRVVRSVDDFMVNDATGESSFYDLPPDARETVLYEIAKFNRDCAPGRDEAAVGRRRDGAFHVVSDSSENDSASDVASSSGGSESDKSLAPSLVVENSLAYGAPPACAAYDDAARAAYDDAAHAAHAAAPALEAPALLDDAGEYDDDLRLLDEFQFGQGLFEADLDEVRAGKGKQTAGTSAALAAPPCFDERVDMDDGSGVFAKATDLGPIAAPLPAGWPVDLAGGI